MHEGQWQSLPVRTFMIRPMNHLRLIGVTGTNGKTTVSTLIRHLLEEPGRPVGLIGTVQYNLGDRDVPSFKTTPEATDLYPMLKSMLAAGCTSSVMEISSHGIHQSRVHGLSLEIAAFMNLTREITWITMEVWRNITRKSGSYSTE